jgi:amidase
LTAITTQGIPKEMRAARAEEAAGSNDPARVAEAAGLVLDFVDFFALAGRREAARHSWREFFRDWDVIVSPAVLDAAFPHPEVPFHARRLQLDDRTVPYLHNIVYPMWAVFSGHPATAFPAGLNDVGLPLGLQAMGPYLEDRTTLRFAQLLQHEWHGFVPPPGY